MILSHFLGANYVYTQCYTQKTLRKSNRTRNDQVKSKVVISVFPLSIKLKENLLFYGKYKIYFISCGEISAFSLVLRTREKY